MQQLLITSSVMRRLEYVVADCLTVSQAIKHYIDIAFLTTWVQLLPNLLLFFCRLHYQVNAIDGCALCVFCGQALVLGSLIHQSQCQFVVVGESCICSHGETRFQALCRRRFFIAVFQSASTLAACCLRGFRRVATIATRQDHHCTCRYISFVLELVRTRQQSVCISVRWLLHRSVRP